MPALYIITGSNGAGKSTVGAQYLPDNIRTNYTAFDGDKLYMAKLKDLWPEKVKALKEAKKLAVIFVEQTLAELIEHTLANNENLIYEGHFPSYSTWDFPKRFKENGYTVNMLFLGLNDPDLSEMRVAIRVKKGGHNVQRWDIENNFYGNLEMLDEHFHLLDHLQIVDTSFFIPKPLATFNGTNVITSLPLNELPVWFTKYLPLITMAVLEN